MGPSLFTCCQHTDVHMLVQCCVNGPINKLGTGYFYLRTVMASRAIVALIALCLLRSFAPPSPFLSAQALWLCGFPAV